MSSVVNNSSRRKISHSRGHPQASTGHTVQITSPVASVHISGVVVDSNDHACDSDSSIEEQDNAIDALCLCEPSSEFNINGSKTLQDTASDKDIGIKDNHYAVPEGFIVGPSTIEALEQAIDKYKSLAKTVEPHTDQAKDIIRRLVQLRLKLFEAKEQAQLVAAGGIITRHVKVVMGHTFEEHSWRSAKGYCEKCNGVIIAIVQTWRRCTACGYCCHSRCMNLISRMCASVKSQDYVSQDYATTVVNITVTSAIGMTLWLFQLVS
jgi:hypothetical protein